MEKTEPCTLIQRAIKEAESKLQGKNVLFSNENNCTKVMEDEVVIDERMKSNREEA